MAAFNKDFLSENDFETGVAIFRCYGHDDNSSKAVDKIATSGKVYHKCPLCIIACSIAVVYH